MSLSVLCIDDLPAEPWRNGGGGTRPIAAHPPGAGDFLWRVSAAEIVADGPFSAFPGIDRVFVPLRGDGVRLRALDGSLDRRCDAIGEPFGFAGEVPLEATLLGAPVRALNVMTRRGAVRAALHPVQGEGAPGPGEAWLLIAVRGAWSLRTPGAAASVLRPGEVAVSVPADAAACWSPCPGHGAPLALAVALRRSGG